ncbi:MAG TPA: hypothetical protein VH575_14455 [Gemmataceae bacterium]|jgi:hypothetical protein
MSDEVVGLLRDLRQLMIAQMGERRTHPTPIWSCDQIRRAQLLLESSCAEPICLLCGIRALDVIPYYTDFEGANVDFHMCGFCEATKGESHVKALLQAARDEKNEEEE